MPCPSGIEVRDAALLIVGTSAAPAKRGTTLQVRPTDNVRFGPLTSAVGQVYFERQIVVNGVPTTQHVDVPVQDVVWSSMLIQITALPNLPGEADGQAKTWTIFLKDASATTPCTYAFVVETVAVGAECPVLVQVANGLYGSAAQPASRSAPVSLNALAGFFGGPTVSSGTVTFTNAFHPQGFASPNVVWQPTVIQFTLPPDLPATPSAAVWEVWVKASGAATDCGPYPIVVEAGPQTPPTVKVGTIPNLPGRTDPRGQPVTLFALGGFFGGATAMKGSVSLTRQSKTVPVPPDDVVWTPVAVTFLVPDLPDTAALAEWDALLTPDGGSALGPYKLQVAVAEPLLIFIPPFIVSEERVELTALGLDGLDDPSKGEPVLSLLAFDTAGNELFGGSKGPPPRGQRSAIGMTVTAPTVLALRQSPLCGPNQLFLDVDLKIQITQDGYSRKTNALRTRIIMPPPQIGRYSKNGRKITLGLPRGATGTTGSYRGCEWIGPYSTGKVELLLPTSTSGASTDENLVALQEVLDELGLALPEGPGDISPQTSPFPPASLISKLQAIKAEDVTKGRQLVPVTQVGGNPQWFEETIEVELPTDLKAGTIVVWRDDLPSLPVTFIEPPTVPCDTTAVSEMVREAFTVTGLPSAGQVLNVGQLLPLQVNREVGIENPLTKLLDQQLSPVTITFEVDVRKGGAVPPGGALLNAGTKQPLSAPSPFNLGGALTMLLRPDLEMLTATTGAAPWEIEVKAKVSGLPLCSVNQALTVDLASKIAFKQANLPVPALVIGIRGRKYHEEGILVPPNGIVFIHPDTPLLGGKKVDKLDGQTQVLNAKNQLFSLFSNLKTLLSLVSGFASLPASPIPPLTTFDDMSSSTLGTPLEQALDTLTRANWSDLTFDGTRSCPDLNDSRDPWWKDRIWSVLMLSAPAGPILELWESPNFSGKRLRLAMPPGNVIGGYWTLWSMSPDHTTIGDLPDPPGDANQIAGMIDSSRWVDPVPLPSGPAASGDRMQPGSILVPDIRSADGRFQFIYQGDGNLVLYGPNGAMWASDTSGIPYGVCIMQGDGNLVIYGPSGQPIWDSRTSGSAGNWLIVQGDGNVVIYRPDGSPHWATNTSFP
jgi:hypothetical protein